MLQILRLPSLTFQYPKCPQAYKYRVLLGCLRLPPRRKTSLQMTSIPRTSVQPSDPTIRRSYLLPINSYFFDLSKVTLLLLRPRKKNLLTFTLYMQDKLCQHTTLLCYTNMQLFANVHFLVFVLFHIFICQKVFMSSCNII